MNLRGSGLAAGVAIWLASAVAHAGPLVEVYPRRGIGGTVAAGGIDLVEIEVRSASDTASRIELVVEGRIRTIDLAARGREVATLARPVPTGATGLPAVKVVVRDGRGSVTTEIPAVRVITRPVVVVTDDPTTMLARVDGWRRSAGYGDPVPVSPEGLPARWQTLVGVSALVLDRPTQALEPTSAQQVTRYLAAGGTVCRWAAGDHAPVCAKAPPIATPRTRQPASISSTVGSLGWIALVVGGILTVGLLLRSSRRRMLVVAAVTAGWIGPFVRSPDDQVTMRGVRVATGSGEDWLVAEIGVNQFGAGLPLTGDLWIERSPPIDGSDVLDDRGLRGRVPGAGSWRVRGFARSSPRGWTEQLAPAAQSGVAAP